MPPEILSFALLIYIVFQIGNVIWLEYQWNDWNTECIFVDSIKKCDKRVLPVSCSIETCLPFKYSKKVHGNVAYFRGTNESYTLQFYKLYRPITRGNKKIEIDIMTNLGNNNINFCQMMITIDDNPLFYISSNKYPKNFTRISTNVYIDKPSEFDIFFWCNNPTNFRSKPAILIERIGLDGDFDEILAFIFMLYVVIMWIVYCKIM